MKTYISIFALSFLAVLTVSAQDGAKLRNDVTYSTHNYKHPNKAAVASKWKQNKGVTVNAPDLSNQQVANYKQPVPGTTPAAGIVVPHTPQVTIAERNYKIPRINISASESKPASDVANRPERQSTSEGN